MILTNESPLKLLKKDNKDKLSYCVYVVFKLPPVMSNSSITNSYLFLSDCLDIIQEENDVRMSDHSINSKEYFTNLNHGYRYRIPKTLKRINIEGSDVFYGIIAFEAFRHESVKNRALNQRVTSINPDILLLERMRTLYVPTSYPYNLS